MDFKERRLCFSTIYIYIFFTAHGGSITKKKLNLTVGNLEIICFSDICSLTFVKNKVNCDKILVCYAKFALLIKNRNHVIHTFLQGHIKCLSTLLNVSLKYCHKILMFLRKEILLYKLTNNHYICRK